MGGAVPAVVSRALAGVGLPSWPCTAVLLASQNWGESLRDSAGSHSALCEEEEHLLAAPALPCPPTLPTTHRPRPYWALTKQHH